MGQDETIASLPLAEQPSRYKKVAEDATILAREATGHARAFYMLLAEKCRRRSEETEAALNMANIPQKPRPPRSRFGLRKHGGQS